MTLLNTRFFKATAFATIFCLFATFAKAQNALNFDGSNDYVSVPNNSYLNTSAITIETWVYWTPNAATDIQFLCSKGNNGTLEIHTGGGAGANGLRFMPTAGVILDVANALPTNTWTHVAFVYDPINIHYAACYINGVEKYYMVTSTPMANNTSEFDLGRRNDGSYYFRGQEDEFALWDYARSQADIQADMLKGIDFNSLWGSNNSSLRAYYKFNQGTAGTSNPYSTFLSDYGTYDYVLLGHFNPAGTLNNFALSGTSSNWVAGGFPAITVSPSTYTYNGGAQGPASSVTTNTGTGTSYTFSYAGTAYDGSTYSASATAPTKAGNYTVTATVAANGNYTSASSAATAFTIGKALLNITANNQSINYGTTVSSLTGAGSYTTTGFKNSDNSSVIGGSVTYTTTYTATTAASTTGITITPVITGLTASNYSFSPVSGAVTVIALPPSITPSGATTFCNNSSVTLSTTVQKSTVQFNGSAQYANLAPLAVTTNTMTMEAWVYANGTQNAYTGLIFARGGTTGATGLIFGADNTKIGYCWYSVGGTYGWTGGPTYPLNTWFHVAVVIEPTQATIYLNGVPTVNKVANAAVNFADILQLAIDNQGGRNLNGQMKDVRIWNTVRTQAQILAGMNGIVPTNSTNLLAFYKMDAGTGTSLQDATGHYTAGSLVGSPSWVTSTSPSTNASYLWSPGGQTTASIVANSSNFFEVTVTDASGAMGTASQAVTVTIAPGNITYPTSNTFSMGTAITSLNPTNVAVGTIATMATGFATPCQTAIDAARNVYVADQSNNAIKKIALNGTVTVLGAGYFTLPWGVAVDAAGNVYVGDAGHGKVQKIAFSNGIYSNPVAIASGLSSPYGVAVDASGNVYVVEGGNGQLQKLTYSNGFYTASVLKTGFSIPDGVAVDANGNIYVANYGNSLVQKITTGGTISSIGSGFSGPNGVAVDASGNVYVGDYGNNAVKIIAVGGQGSTLANLTSPRGVSVDAVGNVYVAVGGNNSLQSVAAAGGTISSYSVSPALPSGLTLNTTTGVISGTPTVAAVASDYTITATNCSGSASTTTNILVKGIPTLSISNSPTYTGAAQAAVVVGTGGGTVSSILYNGVTTIPTNAGSYPITATIAASTNYIGGTYSAGIYTINKATPTLSISNSPTYTGVAQAAAVVGTGGGTVSNILYNGVTTIPTNAGAYALTANITASANYNAGTAISAGTYTINKATPTLSISNSPTYTGAAQAAVVVGTGGGTVSTILYNGVATIPTNAGSYPVIATIAASANYNAGTGVSAGTYTINKATPTITTSPTATSIRYGQTLSNSTLSGVASVGGTFAFTNPTTAPLLGTSSQGYTFTPTSTNYNSVTGTVSVLVNKALPTFGSFVIPSKVYGDAPFTIVPPASNSQGVITYTSLNTNVATVSGSKVTIVGIGNATIVATQAAEGNYDLATVMATLVVTQDLPSTFNYPTPNHLAIGSSMDTLKPLGAPTTTATLATGLSDPYGVAVDAAGNVYVGNYNDVKKISINNGQVSTIGTGFSGAKGVAVDAAGNVFVADKYNHAVVKITTDGAQTTLFTLGDYRLTGIAVDAAGTVYVTDTRNGLVIKRTSNGDTATIGSGFNNPTGVAVDGAGNVYVADNITNTVSKISTNGVVTTIGNGFNHPIGVAVDAIGNVFVVNNGNSVVNMISPNGGITSIGAGFVGLEGCAVDAVGNVYVSDFIDYSGNNAVKKIPFVNGSYFGSPAVIGTYSITPTLPVGLSLNTTNGYISGTPTTVGAETTYTVTTTNKAGNASSNLVIGTNLAIPSLGSFNIPAKNRGDAPLGITAPTSTSKGAFTYTSSNTAVATINGNILTIKGEGTTMITATQAANGIYDMASVRTTFTVSPQQYAPANFTYNSPDTFLIHTDIVPFASTTVAANTVTTLAPTYKGFITPNHVAVDTKGNVFVADFMNHSIQKIASNGSVSTVYTQLTNFNPTSLAVDTLGNLYVTDSVSGTVNKLVYSKSGYGIPTTVANGLKSPIGVAIDAFGNVYVAESGKNVVDSIHYSNGSYGNATAIGSGFSHPSGVAVDATGLVFVADRGNNAIKTIDYNKVENTAIIGSGFNNPTSLAVDKAGNVYVADAGNRVIKQISSNDNYATTNSIGSGFNSPIGVAVDATGNVIVADAGDTLVKEIAAVGGAASVYTIAPALPDGLTIDAATGIISGNANTTSVATTYTVTATNSGGSNQAFVNITVKLWSPVLGNFVIPAQNFVTNPTYSIIDPNSTSTGTFQYISSDTKVATISGNTITLVAAGTSTITAIQVADGDYDSASITCVLRVLQAAPANFSYTTPNTFTKNTAVSTPLMPTSASANDLTSLASSYITYSIPKAVAVDGTGNVYVADEGNNTVKKICISATGVATVSAIATGNMVAVDNAGNVFTVNRDNYTVMKTATDGTVTYLANGFDGATGIAVDFSGNVYVSESISDRHDVKMIPYNNGVYGALVQIGASLINPTSVAVDAVGNVYVTDAGDKTVKKITYSGGNYSVLSVLASGGTNPVGVAVDVLGNVYVADAGSDKVNKMPYTVNTGVYGTFTPIATITSLKGIAVDAAGNVIVVRSVAPFLKVIATSLAGVVSSYSISPALPAGLTFSTDSGKIAGTPTVGSLATTYTVTASNGGGSASTSLVISVNEAVPGNFTYNSPDPVAAFVPITALKPNISSGSGVVSNYSITPALPAGLSIDSLTGIISGTPMVASVGTTYTVTAKNTAGTATANLSLTVYGTSVGYLDKLSVNLLPTAAAAYSLRLLSSAYRGALVQISTTDSIYDVYPDANGGCSLQSPVGFGNNLDTGIHYIPSGGVPSALRTFTLGSKVGGGQKARVTKWYDQSGNGITLSQSNYALQPILINADKTFNLINGVPALYFENGYMASAKTTLFTSGGITMTGVAQGKSAIPSALITKTSRKGVAAPFDFTDTTGKMNVGDSVNSYTSNSLNSAQRIAYVSSAVKASEYSFTLDNTSTGTIKLVNYWNDTLTNSQSFTGNLKDKGDALMVGNRNDGHDNSHLLVPEIILFNSVIPKAVLDTVCINQEMYWNILSKTPVLGTFAGAPSPQDYSNLKYFKLTPPTSNSNGAFTYSTDNSSVDSISHDTLFIMGVGTANVVVTQSATAYFVSATATASFTVKAIKPTITNFSIPSITYGCLPFVPTTPISNSTGAFTYTSSNTAVATITNNIVEIKGVGTFTVTATQAANGNYLEGSIISSTITVNTATPILGKFSVPIAYVPGSITLTPPTSTNPAPFTYSFKSVAYPTPYYTGHTPIPPTISGTILSVTEMAYDTIYATQAASGNYAGATVAAPLIFASSSISATYNSLQFFGSQAGIGNSSFSGTYVTVGSGAQKDYSNNVDNTFKYTNGLTAADAPLVTPTGSSIAGNLSDNFTVETYFKLLITPTDVMPLISNTAQPSVTQNTPLNGWILKLVPYTSNNISTNKLQFEYYPQQTLTFANQTISKRIIEGFSKTSTGFRDQSWHHVAVTRANGVITMFVDGISQGGSPDNNSILSAPNNPTLLTLGAGFDYNIYNVNSGVQTYNFKFFTGALDETRIYQRALSACEILQSMNPTSSAFGNFPDTTSMSLYFNYNQGTANGDNRLVNLKDITYNNPLNLMPKFGNFSLNNLYSNFVVGVVPDQINPVGAIGNPHTVVYPSLNVSDFITDASSNSSMTYSWAKSNNAFVENKNSNTWDVNTQTPIIWEGLSETTLNYDLTKAAPSINTWYARKASTSSGCTIGAPDPVRIIVGQSGVYGTQNNVRNGVISGSVYASDGITGIPNDTIIAYTNIPIMGRDISKLDTAITQSDGTYSFANNLNDIFYGNAKDGDSVHVTFYLYPINRTTHTYNKIVDSVVLTSNLFPNHAPSNRNFIDQSAKAVIGRVTQTCQTCTPANTIAGLDSVQITAVNNAESIVANLPPETDKDTTHSLNGSEGNFGVAIKTSGTYTLTPSYKNHRFKAVNAVNNGDTLQVKVLNEGVSGLIFQDTTTHTISGFVGAGCNSSMGRFILTFQDVLRDKKGNILKVGSQFTATKTTNLDGSYSIHLPAREWKLTKVALPCTNGNCFLDTVTGIMDATAVLYYYNHQLPSDSLLFGIDTIDVQRNLIYSRSSTMYVAGLMSGAETSKLLPNTCFNSPIAKYGLWGQGDKMVLAFQIYQGPVSLGCPANSGDIQVVTDFQQPAGVYDNINLKVENGVVYDTLKAGQPSNIGNYTKYFQVTYTEPSGNTIVYNYDSLIVLGTTAAPGGALYNAITTPFPIKVLHDPPGPNSYSTWNSKDIWALRKVFQRVETATEQIDQEGKLGIIKKSVGFGVSFDIEFAYISNFGGLSSQAFTQLTDSTTTYTFTNNIQTSGNPSCVGRDWDVVIGESENFVYTEATKVSMSPSCKLQTNNLIVMAPNGIHALYAYTINDIKKVVIPQQLDFATQAAASADGTIGGQSADYYKQNAVVWQQIVDQNDNNIKNATYPNNLSISSGTNMDYIWDTARTLLKDTCSNCFASGSPLLQNGAYTGTVYIGQGISQKSPVNEYKLVGKLTATVVLTTVETSAHTAQTTNSFRLQDDNTTTNDNILLGYGRDPQFGTPIFKTYAGWTSCPHEEGTYAIDSCVLVKSDTLPKYSGDSALVWLNLYNLTTQPGSSESYTVSLNNSTNPDGASVSINGAAYNIPVAYKLGYGQGIRIPITVIRNKLTGVNQYNLEIVASDNCSSGDKYSSKQMISLNFPTTDTLDGTIVYPLSNAVVNNQSNKSYPIIFTSSNFNNVQSATLEYQLVPPPSANGFTEYGVWKAAQFMTINNSDLDTISNNVHGIANVTVVDRINWKLDSLPQGAYNLRLLVQKVVNGVMHIAYSPLVTNFVIDTIAPELFGTPTPNYGTYLVGSPISFTYNKNLSYDSVVMTDITTKQVLASKSGCYNNTVMITPPANLQNYAGDSIKVVVYKATDTHGNVKLSADSILFKVGTSNISTYNNPAFMTVNMQVQPLNNGNTQTTPISSNGTIGASTYKSATDVLALMFQSSTPSVTSNQIVNYTLSGDAVNGVDYQIMYPASQNTLYIQSAAGVFNPYPNALTGVKANSGTIVIQADSAQATLFIKPLNNALATGNKNLTLTLCQSGNYNVGLNYAFSLNIKAPATHTESITTCDSYSWNGVTYTKSGIDTFKTTTSPTSGIDSLAILNLTIKQPTSSTTTETTVATSYTWHGRTYTSTGKYSFDTLNVAGCDSTAYLDLTFVNYASSVTVSGNIVSPLNESINTVQMTVDGGTPSTVIQNGYSYSLNLPTGLNHTLSLYKNDDANPMAGINISDFALLKAHIMNKSSDIIKTSPWLMIAADVNEDGVLNIVDLALIKRMILGQSTTFTNTKGINNLWTFVDSTNPYTTAANPFPYKSTITLNNLMVNTPNQTFYALKLGVLNVEANTHILGMNTPKEPVSLFYNDIKTTGDGTVRVPIRVKDFKHILGMQFTLNFNSQLLQLQGIEIKSLNMNYSTHKSSKGQISFMWSDSLVEAQSLDDNTEIMELVFNKQGDLGNTAITISNDVTSIAAYDAEMSKHNIVMTTGKIIEPQPVVPTESWTIAPNPTTGMVNLTLSLTEGKDVEFELLSAEGKKLMQQRLSANSGKSTTILNLGKDTRLSPGIYYLKATGIDALGVKKVIVR